VLYGTFVRTSFGPSGGIEGNSDEIAGCAECMVGFFVISSGVVMTGEGFRSGNEKFICILFA
jgi:hypothetical protein